ncbi:MAG: hypothetical protein AAF502_15720 [Bacteroidota bacterium]
MSIAIILTNFSLLFGFKTRISGVLHTCFLLVAFAFVFSFGNIYHLILWAIFPLVMSFTNWGNSFSIDRLIGNSKRPVEGWPIALMSYFIGFAFFTSGIAKMTGGWLNIEESATYQYLVLVTFQTGRLGFFNELLLDASNSFLWELIDWFVVWFETLFLFAVLKKSIFRWFCVFGIIFHFAILVLLEISFSIHLVVFLVFVEPGQFSAFLGSINALPKKLSVKRPINVWISLMGLLILIYILIFFRFSDHYLVDGARLIDWISFAIAFILIMYCGLNSIGQLNQKREG